MRRVQANSARQIRIPDDSGATKFSPCLLFFCALCELAASQTARIAYVVRRTVLRRRID